MTPEERQMYEDWLSRRRPLLEAKQWTDALRDVPRLLDLEPSAPRLLETATEPFSTQDWEPQPTLA
jgi:hypothetical protein